MKPSTKAALWIGGLPFFFFLTLTGIAARQYAKLCEGVVMRYVEEDWT